MTTAWRRGYVDLPHGQVHVRTAGEPGAPALLLLHQTPDSGRAWDPLLPWLANDWRLIAPDTPGYGDSDPLPEPPSMGDYAAIAVAVLDALDMERCAVVGHHTGAGIAVELAASRPSRVNALVLSGVPYWPEGTGGRLASLGPPPMPQQDGGHLLTAWQRIAERAPDAPAGVVHRRTIDRLRAPDPAIAYHAVYRYPIAERLPLVTCPVLILDGADDPLAAAGAAAAGLLPNGRHERIGDAGVSLVDLLPAEYARRLRGFFGEE